MLQYGQRLISVTPPLYALFKYIIDIRYIYNAHCVILHA